MIFEDFEVRCLDNGQMALAIARVYLPDIVFLDIGLGDLDGRDICESFKENQITKHIPIILMTAGFVNGTEGACGADEIIEKPFNISNLPELVLKYT